MQRIFREYDIRGIYPEELDENRVKKIGYFLGKEISSRGLSNVAIGYDARMHSPILQSYLTSGLHYAGVKVYDIGLVATPVNYFSNYSHYGIESSIMITGSHNPSQYNGFKITIDKKPFFASDIYDLGERVLEAEDLVIPDHFDMTTIDIKSHYIDYIIEHFSHLKNLDCDIVIDCGNGVAGTVIKDIFDRLHLRYKALYLEPDGSFPNHHPDPSVAENLRDIQKELSSGSFKIGFAYDGDADRIAVLTPQNNIKGDILAILYARQMQNPTVIGEVKCSNVMYETINQFGKAIMYKTGHSNLKVKIKELNAQLAAEVSGHIFFADRYFGFDDAIYATLRTLELIQSGLILDDEIAKLPQVYSTEEIKIQTSEDEKFLLIEKLATLLENPPHDFPNIKNIHTVDGLRIDFDKGWGLVRASNTTPVLVTRFESSDQALARLYEEKLTQLVKQAKETL